MPVPGLSRVDLQAEDRRAAAPSLARGVIYNGSIWEAVTCAGPSGPFILGPVWGPDRLLGPLASLTEEIASQLNRTRTHTRKQASAHTRTS